MRHSLLHILTNTLVGLLNCLSSELHLAFPSWRMMVRICLWLLTNCFILFDEVSIHIFAHLKNSHLSFDFDTNISAFSRFSFRIGTSGNLKHCSNLIMTQHQINPGLGIFYKLTSLWCSKMSTSWSLGKDWGIIPDWRSLKRCDNY